MAKRASIVPVERIERAIIVVRGETVMMDEELAALYGVPTKHLLQAVKRNLARFPRDFMFQLSTKEAAEMRSQFVTASKRNVRFRPYAFTEQGVAMLSSVLRSPRAVEVNVEIMRAFVRMRRWAAGFAELAKRIDELEAKYDGQFGLVFEAIRKMMETPAAPAREMGFHTITRRVQTDDNPRGVRRKA